MRIHATLSSSKASGKGNRYVIWTQGCSILCKECFNPQTHSFTDGFDISVPTLVKSIIDANVDGVTITGGEPFDQKRELYKLVRLIRQKTNLNIIIYSGYNYIFLSSNRLCKKIIDLSDAIIAGQYDMTKRIQHSLYGSSNQEVILITSAFNSNDFKGPSIMEIIINQDGQCVITGFPVMEGKYGYT